MTKKRLYALFAVLFAAVFALVCAFTFSACKDKDDEDDKSPDDTTETVPEGGDETEGTAETHEHTYVVVASTWAWTDETHTVATATATCSNEDGLCDETATTVESDKVEAEDSATCTAAGTVTHTAYYGGDVVLTCEGESSEALGHDYEVAFEWTQTEDGWTATATRSCKRGDVEDEKATHVDVTSETDDEYVIYTATAKFSDGTTAKDVKEVPVSGGTEENEDELPEVYLDFGDPSTYSWIGIEADNDGVITLMNGEEYKTGIVTIVASNKWEGNEPKSPTTIADGALNTGGKTTGSEGKYIAIDLTGLTGKYISITATMSAADETGATLHVGTKVETPDKATDSKKGLTYAESTSSTDVVTLSYIGEITQNALYLTCSATVNIYTLSVVITDEMPESGTSTEHEHNYTASLEWVTEGGEVKAKVTLTCDVEGCDKPEVTGYAAVTSEKIAATCTEAAKTTYTAKYDGYTFENATFEVVSDTELATGHTWVLTVDWTGSDEEGWAAETATRTCNVCGDEETGTVEVTSANEGEQVIYTATATFAENDTMTGTKTVDAPQASEEHTMGSVVKVDFGDTGTYITSGGCIANGTGGVEGPMKGGAVDTDGYILYTDLGEGERLGVADGAFCSNDTSWGSGNGTYNGSSGWTNYFTFDLSSLEGSYVEIVICFGTQPGYLNGYVAVTGEILTPTAETEGAVETNSTAQTITLWSGYVEGYTTLYLVFSQPIAIYTIEILVESTD